MQKYLRECLDSILAQTLSGLEIICVNDGSTDNSFDILTEYEEKSHITIINQNNQGSGVARNKGMENARGKYVAFIDPDDYYANNMALETLYYYAENENAMICGGNVKTQYGKYYRTPYNKTQYVKFKNLKMVGLHVSYIYNLKFLKDNQIKYPSHRRFQDPPFLSKAMIMARRFYAVNVDVYIYRINYKKLNYNSDVAVNVINGINDIFTTSYQNNFDTAFPLQVLQDNMDDIMRHICQDKPNVNTALNQLNDTIKDTVGEQYTISNEMIKEYKMECEGLYNAINNGDPLIIYGAGTIGKMAVDSLNNMHATIRGVAVSDMAGNPLNVECYDVRPIEDYAFDCKNLTVIIAVGQAFLEDVKKMLNQHDFKVIYVWTERKMDYIKDVWGNLQNCTKGGG
jgi:hypothetical protein